jgi:DNA-binding response OmpR family regulator
MAVSPPKILIVEDEFLVATDLADELRAMGFLPVGPAANLNGANKIMASEDFDGALLDISLRGEAVFPFAHECLRRNLPIAFTSAYSLEDIPADLRHIPALDKPWTSRQLRNLMTAVFPATPPADAGGS